MSESITLAAQNDAVYAAALNQAHAADSAIDVANAANGISAGLGLSASSAKDLNFGQQTNQLGATLSASKSLYSAVNKLQVNKAQLLSEQAMASLRDVEEQLMMRVASAYFSHLKALARQQSAQSQRRAINRQLEVIQAQYESGLSAAADVSDARARLDQSKVSVISAEIMVKTSLAELEQLLAQPVGELKMLSMSHQFEPIEADLDYWLALVDARLDVKNAMMSSEVGEFDVNLAEKASRPSVSLNVELSSSYIEGVGEYVEGLGAQVPGLGDTSDNGRVSLDLQWSILSGGRVQAELRKAIALTGVSVANLRAARDNGVRLIRAAYLTAAADGAKLKAMRSALASARISRDAAKAGYDLGTRSALELLNALQSVFSAETALVDALYDAALNRLSLKRESGQLHAEDFSAY